MIIGKAHLEAISWILDVIENTPSIDVKHRKEFLTLIDMEKDFIRILKEIE